MIRRASVAPKDAYQVTLPSASALSFHSDARADAIDKPRSTANRQEKRRSAFFTATSGKLPSLAKIRVFLETSKRAHQRSPDPPDNRRAPTRASHDVRSRRFSCSSLCCEHHV